MAEPMQLDQAARLVGKSEVTLRRLIKAGKIPFEKEKTLTGFIYKIDPEKVRAYYHIRVGGVFGTNGKASDDDNPFESLDEKERSGPAYMPKSAEPLRIAVEDAGGHASEYWQKRSDLYEDKYHQEVQKHATLREELGVWRGRAEQAQAMIIKMLPPAETPAIQAGEPVKEEKTLSWVAVLLGTLTVVIIVGGIGFYMYARYYSGR